MRKTRPGWTLLELLVVIAMLGVLLALALAAVNKAREAANCSTCLNNFRQLALAVHEYNDGHHKLPPYATTPPQATIFGGWWVHLMPYADQEVLYQDIVTRYQAITYPSGPIAAGPVRVFQKGTRDLRFQLLTCPSDPSASRGKWVGWVGTSNYLANWYVFGDASTGCYGARKSFRDIPDGLSKTVLFAEGYSHCNNKVRPALWVCYCHNFGITPQLRPSDDPSYLPNDYTMFQVQPLKGEKQDACDFWRPQTAHTNMPVALADGSTRFIQPDVSPSLWKQLLKPADGGPSGGSGESGFIVSRSPATANR